MANEQNLRPGEHKLTEEEAKRGGIASGKARRERRTLRELMLEELAKDGGGGLTKAQYLVAKAMNNHAKGKLTFKDLKDLQDLLGESVQKVDIQGASPIFLPTDMIDAISKASSKKEE